MYLKRIKFKMQIIAKTYKRANKKILYINKYLMIQIKVKN